MSWAWTLDTRAALAGFLRHRDLIVGEPTIDRIGDGHSNLTFLVDDGDRRVVVRRPPPPPTPPGSHDVLREARLLRALAPTAVPVADVLATGAADEVFDVPFYVMEHVPGVVVTTEASPGLTGPACARAMSEALVDHLADLHALDPAALGLADFGRPGGFNRRHLRRIAGLVADLDGALPPAFAELHDWLADTVPAEAGATIVHNDYRLGNVMWAAAPPARLLAILDWELATLGDPLIDVAYLLASRPLPSEPQTPTQAFGTAMLEPGWLDRHALARRYAELSGRDLSTLAWYETMVNWKLAVLYEYSRRRGQDRYYADPCFVSSFLAAARQAAGLRNQG